MISDEAPLICQWDGEAFRPATPYQSKRADVLLVVGQRYALVEHQERSQVSHNHYFATLNEAWRNLPESAALEYPTSEHLRKKALIHKGWATTTTYTCTSNAEAMRLAAAISAIEPYSVVAIKRAVVERYSAKSQNQRVMGKSDFQKSKDDVLDYCAEVLEVARDKLELQARSRA